MKILITGGNGQLGRELMIQLQDRDFLATDIKATNQIVCMNIMDPLSVNKVVGEYKPDVIIHAAAYTDVDCAETDKDQAFKVNAIGTQNVAAACLAVGAKLVYISTDYVFDGKLGRAYNEFDTPTPTSVYGKSKLAGEILAKQIVARSFIIRTAWLYGDGNNFVRTMLRIGTSLDGINVVDDQYGSPTSTVDLAKVILQLIETEHYGTYNVTNQGITNWYLFAKKIFELSGNTKIFVSRQSTKDLGRPAPRPVYAPMEHLMLRLTIGDSTRPWEEALAEYLNKN